MIARQKGTSWEKVDPKFKGPASLSEMNSKRYPTHKPLGVAADSTTVHGDAKPWACDGPAWPKAAPGRQEVTETQRFLKEVSSKSSYFPMSNV